jgi:hypothetical protein
MSWTPLNLPSLSAFYRADQGVTQSGGNVSAWADQSSNAQNLTITSATPPTWSGSSFGGFPGITFSTANDTFLQTTSFSFSSAAMSIASLVIPTANSGNDGGRVVSLQANGVATDYTNPSIVLGIGSGGPSVFGLSTTIIGDGGGTPSIVPNTAQILGLTLDGIANGNVSINLVNQGAPTAFSSIVGSNPNILSIGMWTDASSQFDGVMGYTIITAAAFQPGDIENLITWTNNNFGTNFPGGIPAPTLSIIGLAACEW